MEDPKTVLIDVFKFLLDTDDIEGTIVESLIEKEVSPEKELYYQRDPSGRSFKKFSEIQKNTLKSLAGCVVRRLGYGSNFISPVNPISPTNFFENDDYISDSKVYELDSIVKNRDEYYIKVRYDYLQLNKLALSKVKGRQEIDKTKLLELRLNHESEKLRAGGVKQCLRPYRALLKKVIKA